MLELNHKRPYDTRVLLLGSIHGVQCDTIVVCCLQSREACPKWHVTLDEGQITCAKASTILSDIEYH